MNRAQRIYMDYAATTPVDPRVARHHDPLVDGTIW